ncbi:FAD-dependent monooxygenase [Kiloniella sp. b19]|uniref:FAD-dependent monooxygenase n=1 Tax=Kiloniella sp. GXU_MW_B19 TaxID=3141326 RepID=UPI0031D2198D
MKILVCGGGIAGLSATIALQQQGHQVSLIERSENWQTFGAGLHLPGNSEPLLKHLGVLEAVERQSASFEQLCYCRADGKALFSLNVAAQGWPRFRALSRQSFHRILLDRADLSSARTGVAVKSVSAEGHVILSDGTQENFDLVIGADGIGSRVRRSLFGEACKPQETGFRCWRWIADDADVMAYPRFVMGRGVVLLAMPLEGGKTYVFVSVHDPEEQFRELSVAAMKKLLEQFEPGLVARLTRDLDPHNLHEGTLQQMEMQQWSRGRVVLIGDAAHGTLPTLAQGAAQSMKDAIELAAALDEDGEISVALARFERRRKPEAHWVQGQSFRRMGLARLDSPVAVFCRNALLRLLGSRILASGWRPLIDGNFAGRPE